MNGGRNTMNGRGISANEMEISVNGDEDTINGGGKYGEWRGNIMNGRKKL